MTSESPLVLTIAGFDPSGGAGIIADVRTIVQFGCRPAAALTSLTFQNADGFLALPMKPLSPCARRSCQSSKRPRRRR